jgi:hypothetical protein
MKQVEILSERAQKLSNLHVPWKLRVYSAKQEMFSLKLFKNKNNVNGARPQLTTKIGFYLKISRFCWRLTRLNNILEGFCRWKLLSGNLYTFIRPNQKQKRKMEL